LKSVKNNYYKNIVGAWVFISLRSVFIGSQRGEKYVIFRRAEVGHGEALF